MKNNRINIEYDLYPFDLRDAFYNSMYDNNTKDILNDIVLEIMDYLTIVEEIFEAINDDEKKITDEEFINRINKFFSISIDENQCLKMFSTITNKEFVGYSHLLTNISFSEKITKGKGNDFSWWTEYYQLVLKVMIAKDTDIDKNKKYTKAEIDQLIKEQKIIIVGVDTKKCGKDSYEENSNNSKEFESFIINDKKYESNFDNNSKYYPQVLKYVRENIDSQYINNYSKKFLYELQKEVIRCLKYVENKDDGQHHNNTVKTSFEGLEKMGYKRILSKLKKTYVNRTRYNDNN